jgi:hypothetical protein
MGELRASGMALQSDRKWRLTLWKTSIGRQELGDRIWRKAGSKWIRNLLMAMQSNRVWIERPQAGIRSSLVAGSRST